MPILYNLVSTFILVTLTHGLSSLQNSTSSESNEITEGINVINYRLPTDILPTHYIIKLEPNLEVDDFSFEGKSSININVLTANKTMITLHARDLTIDEEYTTLVGINSTVKPVTHSINNVTDFLTIGFDTPIAVGSHWLNLKYTGLLKSDYKGFFRTSYNNDNGKKVWLAATDFEATDAREAFPCFDEPAMKAKFEISIKHFDNYTAVSNMPALNKTKDDSQKIWTNFEVTPLMSTYLVAFVISDFKNISSDDGRIRCWSEEKKIHNCRFAVDESKKVLEALEDYMGSRHVITKLDNVVMPSFTTQGMENWGLITYSEDRILYEKGVTTTARKQVIVETLIHEFVHQWIGNLVSPAWWDHIWLSEGIANYFQYFIADKIKPNWRMMDQMVVECLQIYVFMVTDFVIDEHPINTKVNNPSEIEEIFDTITYYRGGIIIRMISHVLTDKVFQRALRQYIKTKEYGSATSEELFNVLASTAENIPKNISLKLILNSWIDQSGYPVIHVNRNSASHDYVLINQRRFTDLHTTNMTSTNLWWIPLNYATQSNPNFNDTQPSHWLEPSRHQQKVPLKLSNNQWFIFNKQQTGPYRVNYDKENWLLIADYLNTPNYTNIHVLNRAQLLDDSFNLAHNGYLNDYSVFLNISRYLAQEDDYIAWYPAFCAFETLNKVLKNTETHKLFKLYIRKLIENVEERVGYTETPEDDHIMKLNRVEVIKWACEVGSVKCNDATRNSVIEHVNGSKKISTDLQEIIFCAGIRTANMTIWNKVFNYYFEAKDEEEREFILNGLGCSVDSNIIKSYLAKVLDPDLKIRINQDPLFKSDAHLFPVADRNEAGVDIMLNFVKENFATLNQTQSSWDTEYINAIGVTMSTDEQIKKLNEIPFNIDKEVIIEWSQIVRSQYMEKVNWLKKYEPQIRSFLLSQNLVDDSTMKSS